ncbi:Serine protease easter [Dufourea novaeangliae]|uniref:CLIP domain-containing serine protease n=1 Tax=Dufourea novaeangliae TaxID=178035 RepID=A0A154PQG6_DUFNO|nr:Serine protease easter [Dufourea novaeangliae]
MFSSSVFLHVALAFSVAGQTQCFLTEPYSSNSINCPNDKMCTHIENCPAVFNLMSQNLLPIHRFRQAICGYENVKAKICCDLGSHTANPAFTQAGGTLFTRSNSILECGKSFVRSNSNTLGMYPFVARIGFMRATGKITYPCTGVILNERTILTTASCALAKTDDYKLYSVLVGEFNAETDPDCNTQKHNISYVIKHPNYQTDTFANNIAMLRLQEPIQYTASVQPICLPPADRLLNPTVSPVLVGWGKLSSQRMKSCQQQSLRMRIIPNQECSSYYDQGLSVELCAIGDEMPCSGYSGSPLLFRYGDSYFLLGILSYGSNCNSATNFPSVFVNVLSYIRWILENC